MKRILIIGCGHMGSSLLRAWLNVSNYKFYVVDPIKYKILKKDRKFKNINFYNDLKKIDDYTKFSLIVFAKYYDKQVENQKQYLYQYSSFEA